MGAPGFSSVLSTAKNPPRSVISCVSSLAMTASNSPSLNDKLFLKITIFDLSCEHHLRLCKQLLIVKKFLE